MKIPVIVLEENLRLDTQEAFRVLGEWRSDTDHHRFIARYGSGFTWIVHEGHQRTPAFHALDINDLRNVLAEMADWQRDQKSIAPPTNIIQNMFADRNAPLPFVDRLVQVPVMAPDGSIHENEGYDAESRCFLVKSDVEVPPISAAPTQDELTHARGIIHDIIGDFPFAGSSEYAHAVAFGLLPFVRGMISGDTPIHLADAPTPGTGKSLLVKVQAIPAYGKPPAFMAMPGNRHEWNHTLGAALEKSPPYVVIDNLPPGKIISDVLALATTAEVFEVRRMTTTTMITAPVTCAWMLTGNNVQLDWELARRTVPIRLDARVEDPGGRVFRYDDLIQRAKDRRGALVWAYLTMARAWVAADRPGPNLTLDSYESWSLVVGGILHNAGIEGFLCNVEEFRSGQRTEDEATAMMELLVKHMKVGQRFTSAAACEGLGERMDIESVQQMGFRLRRLMDRPINGYVLRQDGTMGRSGGVAWVIREMSETSEMSEVA